MTSWRAPARWRNRNRCVVDGSLEPIDKPVMGTEYDWMTFLFAVNTQFGLNELMSVYNHACHPSYDPDPLDPIPNRRVETLCGASSPTGAAASPIAWEDGRIGAVTVGGVASGGTLHGGFASGARRKWGVNSIEVAQTIALGNEHGVSDLVP